MTCGKFGSRYTPPSAKSANSKCTSRSSRWQQLPFLPCCTRPFIRLPSAPPLLPVASSSASTVPGHHPRRTCSFVPHCLPHWSIRFIRCTVRPTLSLIVDGEDESVRMARCVFSGAEHGERTYHVSRMCIYIHLRPPMNAASPSPPSERPASQLANTRVSNLHRHIKRETQSQHKILGTHLRN